MSNYVDIDVPIKNTAFLHGFIRGAKKFQKPRVSPYIVAVINNDAF